MAREVGRPTSKAREKPPGDEVDSQSLSSFSFGRKKEWEQGILLNYIYICVTTGRPSVI